MLISLSVEPVAKAYSESVAYPRPAPAALLVRRLSRAQGLAALSDLALRAYLHRLLQALHLAA